MQESGGVAVGHTLKMVKFATSQNCTVVQAYISSTCKLTIYISERVSEWLLLSANSAIVQLYHGENKLIFNDMMVRSTVY